MIKRYRHSGGVIYVNTRIGSNTKTADTTSTATFTTVLSGEPGAVVTINVSSYSHTAGAGGASFTVDGTVHVLGDTFTKTLDGTGNYTMTQVFDVGTTTSGESLYVNLHLTATTIGIVDPINNLTSNSKTVA